MPYLIHLTECNNSFQSNLVSFVLAVICISTLLNPDKSGQIRSIRTKSGTFRASWVFRVLDLTTSVRVYAYPCLTWHTCIYMPTQSGQIRTNPFNPDKIRYVSSRPRRFWCIFRFVHVSHSISYNSCVLAVIQHTYSTQSGQIRTNPFNPDKIRYVSSRPRRFRCIFRFVHVSHSISYNSCVLAVIQHTYSTQFASSTWWLTYS
jgi:hypothetical protein